MPPGIAMRFFSGSIVRWSVDVCPIGLGSPFGVPPLGGALDITANSLCLKRRKSRLKAELQTFPFRRLKSRVQAASSFFQRHRPAPQRHDPPPADASQERAFWIDTFVAVAAEFIVERLRDQQTLGRIRQRAQRRSDERDGLAQDREPA